MLSPRTHFQATHFHSWEVLWDASSYFERLSADLETARHSIQLVGWQVDSRIPLPPGAGLLQESRPQLSLEFETLKNKLLRLVENSPHLHIDLLMWDHAYVYVFEREPWEGRVWDELHPRIRFVFDNRHPVGASHHEKLAVIDGKIAYCGGIDLCDERWDTPNHLYQDPRRSLSLRKEHHGPYHDIGVRVTGPVSLAISHHIVSRWKRVTTLAPLQLPKLPKPPESPSGPFTPQASRVYLSRTEAELEGKITREVEFLFLELIDQAKQRIVLEGQYYWSKRVNDRLIARMEALARQRPPGVPPLEITLNLTDLDLIRSANRLMAPHQLTLLTELTHAAQRTGTRLKLQAPQVLSSEPGQPPRLVYVHSKVVLIDDRFLSIGSANLATRAFRVDTEFQLTWEATSPSERQAIEAIAQRFEEHWTQGALYPRPIDAPAELQTQRNQSPWLSRFPWEKIFDPGVPWFYPLRRHFVLTTRLYPAITALIIALAWLCGALTVIAAAGLDSLEHPSWPLLSCLLAASTWLLPIPFVALTVAGTLTYGPELALRIFIPALWVSSFLGYFWNRAFPSWGLHYFQASGLTIPSEMGRKNFRALLRVLLDPRISVRAKIAGQGVFSIYLPWFILAHLLILPGEITVLIRLTAIAQAAVKTWIPDFHP